MNFCAINIDREVMWAFTIDGIMESVRLSPGIWQIFKLVPV